MKSLASKPPVPTSWLLDSVMFQTDAVNRSCKWYDAFKTYMMLAFPADIELESAKHYRRGGPWVCQKDTTTFDESAFAFFYPKGHAMLVKGRAAWVEAKRAKRESSPAPADQLPLRLPAGSPPPPAPVRQALESQPKEGARMSNMAEEGARKTNMAKLNR